MPSVSGSRLPSRFALFTAVLFCSGYSCFPASVTALCSIPVGSQEETTDKPQNETHKHAARFLELLVAGKYEKATENFDATMKKVMSAEQLQATWVLLQLQAGAYQRYTEVSSSRSGVYQVLIVSCQFKRTPLDLVLTLNDQQQVAGFSFRPTYQAPDYADSTKFGEVAISIGEPPWELPGTLSLPRGDGPFPAVVLVHGSGPHDRDESIGPNKPFRDLAHGLASRGIAVVRFEKRTLVYGREIVKLGNTTVKEESVEDALLAVELLRGNPKIDSGRIHVLGHSWGGYLLPRIIQADSEHQIASAIVFAGNTRSLPELFEAQIPYLLELDGSLSASDQRQIEETKKLAAKIRDVEQLNALDDGEMVSGAPKTYYLDLHDYQPVDLAVKVFSKALFLQGERDYQVTMDHDFAVWKSKLAALPGMVFTSYPKLNHLFIPGRGQSKPSEYQIPGHVDLMVIQDIADWVTE